MSPHTKPLSSRPWRNNKLHFPEIKLTTLPAFYSNADYIKVLSESIAEGLKDFEYDHILFSYHGIPERHIRKSDPTKFHCKIDGTAAAKRIQWRTIPATDINAYDTTELVKGLFGFTGG